VPIGRYGDCYDRFILRIEEMRQSIHIILQCLSLIPSGPIRTDDIRFTILPNSKDISTRITMQLIIDHFKFYVDGFKLLPINSYTCVETPKGEFGVYLAISDIGCRAHRCKIRAPGYFHLQSLDNIVYGRLLSDLVTVLGSIDIVFGEIDR